MGISFSPNSPQSKIFSNGPEKWVLLPAMGLQTWHAVVLAVAVGVMVQWAVWLILQWHHIFTHCILRCARKIWCHYSVKQLLSLSLASPHQVNSRKQKHAEVGPNIAWANDLVSLDLTVSFQNLFISTFFSFSFLFWSFLRWCLGYERARGSSSLAKRDPSGPSVILGFVPSEVYKEMTHPGPSLGFLMGHAAE